MNKNRFCLIAALLLLASLTSGCSTYKTNSKTRFDSVLLSGQEPVIHVGDIKETPDKLSLLGWVDARVTQPSWFSAPPTQAMADIILAEKGEELGADAIIYVTYKTSKTSLLNTRIEARGQAVRLKDRSARLQDIAPRRTVVTPEILTTPEALATPQAPASTTGTASQPIATGSPAPAPVATTGQPAKPAPRIQFDEDLPTTVEEMVKITPPDTPVDTPAISLEQHVVIRDQSRQQAQLLELAEKAAKCSPDINDIAEYESRMESVEYMLMNAEFLQNKARSLNNDDMESAASRLVQMLELLRANLKREKPAVSP